MVPPAIAVDPEVLLRIVAIATLAAAGAVLPLSAAIREARRPRDPAPLDIDSRYRKDDRYFATSFEELITEAIGPLPRPAGIHSIHLHENESVETIGGSFDLRQAAIQPNILDVQGDLRVEPGSKVKKEMLVGGSAQIGDDVHLRALKTSGSIELGQRAEVERWIDAGRRLRVGDHSRLGVRATSLEEIVLGEDVQFLVVSAPRIIVAGEGSARPAPRPDEGSVTPRPVSDFANPKRSRIRGDGALLVDDEFTVPEDATVSGNVIARKRICVGRGAKVKGSLHSEAEIEIGDGAVISGSVYAERTLNIGRDAVITEHALTAGSATVASGARVGTDGRVTTLLADQSVELQPGVVLYGRVVSARGVTRLAE